MNAPPTPAEPQRTPSRRTPEATAGRRLAIAFALIAMLAALVHPIGDALDEAENISYIDHLVREGRLGEPRDGLRQAVHPPLSFIAFALASRPLEAVVPLLPDEIVWPWVLRITVPLHRPSEIVMREAGVVRRAGPQSLSAGTLLGLRFFSALLGGAGLALSAAAVRRFRPRRPWLALGTLGFLTFTPTLLLQCGAVSMEPMLLLWTAWAAYECALGYERPEAFRPWRLGVACGLAMLTRHSGAAALAAAFGFVAWLTAGRAPLARVKAAAQVAAGAAACLLPWFVYNKIHIGAFMMVREYYEAQPEMLRPMAATAADLDGWLPEVLHSYFGLTAPGVTPLQSLFVAWALMLGACIVGAISAVAQRGEELGRAARTLAWIAGPALAVAFAIPFAGNFIAFQAQGRYLVPAVAFAAPLAAVGFERTLALGERRASLLWMTAASAVPSLVMLIFSLAPLFAPRASRMEGALAYADCGGAYDPGRERGVPQRVPSLLLFPSPQSDVVIDFERVVYQFAIARPAAPMWLHIGLIGGSIGRPTIPVFNIPSLLDHAFPACRIKAGDAVLGEFVSPPAEATTWSYPIPPEALVDGKLRLEIERVGTAPIVAVSEIRIDTNPPAIAEQRGPILRVCAADARAGQGTRIADLAARSAFLRRNPIGAKGSVAETPKWALKPGRYVVRAHVRIREGPWGEPVGLLIAGNGDQPLSKLAEIRVDPKQLGVFHDETLEFEVPPGPPLELSTRIEVNGDGFVDVDDLEVLGPL